MTGKRFEAPRPTWNILKRLAQLADNRDEDLRPMPTERISSPVEAFSGPPDLCPGKSAPTAGRPVSVGTVADCEVMP